VLSGAVTAVGALFFPGIASAHTAVASVETVCVDGATTATVTFTNNYDLAGVVTYSGARNGSASMPAGGSAAVNVTVQQPSALSYMVRWSDGFEQGDRSVSIVPITNCHPPTTTTTVVETTTSTTVPTVDTTVPQEAPTTIATAPEASTTVPTVLGVERTRESVPVQQPAARPAAAPTQLPATGSSDTTTLTVVGGAVVLLGAILLIVRRVPRTD